VSNRVPDSHSDLLLDEKRAFAFLATIMQDGTPQVTPLWFDREGELIRVNTAKGRVKYHNMKERPTVAIAIMDPDDPYRYLQIRGKVVEATEEGARQHIDRLSWKYRGEPKYPVYPGEVRVLFKIQPFSVSVMG
jgi:PPOX class probable F420-dependent enzyme